MSISENHWDESIKTAFVLIAHFVYHQRSLWQTLVGEVTLMRASNYSRVL